MKRQLHARLTLAGLTLLGLAGALPAAAQTGAIAEYPLPTANSQPVSIVAGPDGALWFTEGAGNRIGRVGLDGAITEFPIPTVNSSPDEIALGPDGNLWFAEVLGNRIGRITPTGAITEFTVPTPASQPIGVAAGPDGNVWFTEVVGNKVGRITPSGEITEFPVPTAGSRPLVPAGGPDGGVWFTEQLGNKIGRVDPATGDISEFPLLIPNSRPFEITGGPDGDVWFTERLGNRIGRITPAGAITEFAVPTSAARPNTIRQGPDPNAARDCAFQLDTLGAAAFAARYATMGDCVASLATTKTLWFTEDAANRVAQITTDGTIFEYQVPTPGSQPIGIARGPEDAVWFAEFLGNKIGRLDVQAVGMPAQPGDASGTAPPDPLVALLGAQ
jgi:streptogramin lyase